MGDASYLQTSFLGGEWSSYAQGRADKENYRTALNVCRNSFPIEEGAWTRRSGFWHAGPTRKGAPGKILEVEFTEALPYNVELTDGHMRFYAGTDIIPEATWQFVTVSTANPAVARTPHPHGYTTLDEVKFFFTSPVINGTDADGFAFVFNRQYEITVLDEYTFSLADPITGVGLDGTDIALQGNVLSVARILDFATPWTGTLWKDVTLTQDEDVALMMHPSVPTQALSINAVPNLITGAPAGFSFAKANFVDGPYLDPPTDGSTLTPSGLSGVITLTLGLNVYSSGTTYGIGDVVADDGVTYTSLQDSNIGHDPATSGGYWSVNTGRSVSVNAGQGFLATDVGRPIRLFSEPADWDSATAYAKGATVKYAGTYWSAIAGNTNQEPDVQITYWAISTTAALWSWGTITAVTAGVPTVQLKGGALLYTLPIVTYQIGVYSDTTGYPAAGTFLGGRFWLMSPAIGNRLDSTMVNNQLVFSPTAPDGTVEDDSGISAVLQATDVNTLFWAISDHNGLVVGSQGGEWAVQASNNNDPITPTSIQAHRVTRYGAANIQPVRAGLSVAFVQKYGRKLYEYIADVYSGKYSGTNLSLNAKHLSAPLISEIAYQQELLPAIWARCNDGSLIGCTYKRESPFGTQPASFSGWHRHDLGDQRSVESIQGGPAVGGNLDTIATVSVDPNNVSRWVSVLATMFDEDDMLYTANFLDSSRVPNYAQLIDDNQSVRFYGYYYLANATGISVFAGGLDLGGNFTVSAEGWVDVPFASNGGNPLFTQDYMATLTAQATLFPSFDVRIGGTPTGPLDPHLGAISWFDLTGAPGSNGGFTLPNYDAGTVLIPGGNALNEWSTSGQALLRTKLATDIAPTATETGITGLFVRGGDNQIYMPYTAGGAVGPVYQIDATSWDLTGTLGDITAVNGGTSGDQWSPSVHNVPKPGTCCTVETGLNTFFLTTSLIENEAAGVTLNLIAGENMVMNWAIAHWVTPNRIKEAYVCTGPTGVAEGLGLGTAYVLGVPIHSTTSLDENPLPMNFAALTVRSNAAITPWTLVDGEGDGVFLDTIKQIHPSDVDATWTHWNFISGLLYDQTDGNVIACVETDVPANYLGTTPYNGGIMVRGSNGHDYFSLIGTEGDDPTTTPPGTWQDLGLATYTAGAYIIKISTADGSIVWKVSPPGNAIPGTNTLSFSRCLKGRFDYALGDANPAFYRLDTIAGTIDNPQSIIGIEQVFSSQIYDDKTGTWIVHTNYTDVGGAPVPVGTTPGSFDDWAVFTNVPQVETEYHIPTVIGYTYTSQGQILRPIVPQETGARNGPALGKTRRTHQFAALLANVVNGCIYFGSDFASTLHVAKLQSPGGRDYTPLQLYTGTHQEVLEADYDFDNMPAWQITRPLPATVLAFEAYLHTQDR